MRVHQVLVGASPGDAVTNIALAMADALPDSVESHIWALYLDPRMWPTIEAIERMPDGATAGPDDVVVYHVSMGDERVSEMVLRRPERLVLHYHNITPSSFYTDLDPEFARLLTTGREQLVRLAARADLVIADSTFNADEVRPHTIAPIVVTPPPLDFHRLDAVAEHEPTRHHLEAEVHAPIILHVGQVLPHKRPELLVEAMYILTVELRVPAALIIVGPHRNRDYAWALQHLIEDLGLTNVALAGERTDAELVAHLRAATVFATATAHEGFCVPVVEAFAFDLPVLATAAGAIPETVGDAGLLLSPDCGPALLAEAFALMVGDGDLRETLAMRGRERLDHITNSSTSGALTAAILEVAG